MSNEVRNIRIHALEVLKFNNVDIPSLLKKKKTMETFEYTMGIYTYTYRYVHAGHFYFLSVKLNEDYIPLYQHVE